RAQARRVIAALLLGAAVWAGITAFAPSEPEREQTVTLTRDLPAGHRLAADDLTSVPVEPRHAPASRLTDSAGAVGQVLAHSMERGEVLTAARLRPARELTGLTLDERALHVPVSDRGSLALVRPGDRVDVVSSATGELVGAGLLVLSIDAASEEGDSDAAGLVLAVPPADVGRIVPAAVGSNADGVQVALRADRPPP
ncbi:SAF domain-containing protein, partial [Piscicoccus intestinalis]|uniref:SAF domain-containing protein n=1 Tax=Piscicoccus intestinalis TaxID=746033 RepID=UPI00083913EC